MYGFKTGIRDVDGNELLVGDVTLWNDNPEDLGVIYFGKFPVRDLETYEVYDMVYGIYQKAYGDDPLSKCEPFCFEGVMNEFWVKECNVKKVRMLDEAEYAMSLKKIESEREI